MSPMSNCRWTGIHSLKTKVFQIIKCTGFIDDLRNILTNSLEEVMTDMRSIKEMIQCATIGISKEIKNAVLFSLLDALNF